MVSPLKVKFKQKKDMYKYVHDEVLSSLHKLYRTVRHQFLSMLAQYKALENLMNLHDFLTFFCKTSFLRPPKGSVKLISIKLTNIVSFVMGLLQ